jgi:hypothetical protein
MAALAMLSGCSWMRVAKDECLQPQPWEKAVGVAPLRAVDGLPAPSGKSALKVPEGAPLTPPGTAWKPHCLDAPPRFTSGQKAVVPVSKPTEATAVPSSGTP